MAPICSGRTIRPRESTSAARSPSPSRATPKSARSATTHRDSSARLASTAGLGSCRAKSGSTAQRSGMTRQPAACKHPRRNLGTGAAHRVDDDRQAAAGKRRSGRRRPPPRRGPAPRPRSRRARPPARTVRPSRRAATATSSNACNWPINSGTAGWPATMNFTPLYWPALCDAVTIATLPQPAPGGGEVGDRRGHLPDVLHRGARLQQARLQRLLQRRRAAAEIAGQADRPAAAAATIVPRARPILPGDFLVELAPRHAADVARLEDAHTYPRRCSSALNLRNCSS